MLGIPLGIYSSGVDGLPPFAGQVGRRDQGPHIARDSLILPVRFLRCPLLSQARRAFHAAAPVTLAVADRQQSSIRPMKRQIPNTARPTSSRVSLACSCTEGNCRTNTKNVASSPKANHETSTNRCCATSRMAHVAAAGGSRRNNDSSQFWMHHRAKRETASSRTLLTRSVIAMIVHNCRFVCGSPDKPLHSSSARPLRQAPRRERGDSRPSSLRRTSRCIYRTDADVPCDDIRTALESAEMPSPWCRRRTTSSRGGWWTRGRGQCPEGRN